MRFTGTWVYTLGAAQVSLLGKSKNSLREMALFPAKPLHVSGITCSSRTTLQPPPTLTGCRQHYKSTIQTVPEPSRTCQARTARPLFRSHWSERDPWQCMETLMRCF